MLWFYQKNGSYFHLLLKRPTFITAFPLSKLFQTHFNFCGNKLFGRAILKTITIKSIISLLLFVPLIRAQEVAPLQLGNIWIYDTGTILVKVTVVDTNSVINTIRYSKFINISNYGFISDGYSRLREDDFYASRRDTSYPAPNHEKIYWKKNALLGDTWENYAPDFPLVYTILEIYTGNVFGIPTVIKHLQIDGSLVLFNEYWTEEFGKMSRSDFGGLMLSLRGCVIDGVAYGDTSFNPVGVEDEFSLNEFYLSQNFPNPFNPSTSINFTLPEGDFISLEVYNIIGEKVKTLINEFKTSGIHTIQFEADALTSGTYLYVLRTPTITQTKKMQLVK